jgi:HSP20 family protein
MKNERDVARADPRPELVPPVDIYDTDGAVVVLADMPGVRSDALEVDVDRGALTIRGRRDDPVPGGRLSLREFRVGDYVRSFKLGEDIDVESITAELANGVLRLTLPKGPERKVRKITVKGG